MRKYVLATVSLFALGAFVGLSQPASADTSPNGYNPGHGNHNDHRPVRAHFVGTFAYSANYGAVYWNWAITTGGSANALIDGSFGGAQGVIQINQNVGPNSLLQNSAAIAVFRYCGEECTPVNLATVAVSANYGEVRYNFAGAKNSHANATIRNSFGNAQGVVNVNQNAGANSLLQNSASVAAILPSGR